MKFDNLTYLYYRNEHNILITCNNIVYHRLQNLPLKFFQYGKQTGVYNVLSGKFHYAVGYNPSVLYYAGNTFIIFPYELIPIEQSSIYPFIITFSIILIFILEKFLKKV